MADGYHIIYADPPWDYRGQVQHGGQGKPFTSGARAFYPVMSAETIQAMPVERLMSRDCIVYMWAPGPLLVDAINTLKAWGAPFVTVAFVWDKQRVNPGHYTMSQCEFVLVGKRGKFPLPRGARNVRQLVSEARTTHSAKPEEVRRRIDEMHSPEQRRLELFARTCPEGWHVWGDDPALTRLSILACEVLGVPSARADQGSQETYRINML